MHRHQPKGEESLSFDRQTLSMSTLRRESSTDMAFEGGDKTDRFLTAARRRAQAAMHETSPKLTALEKAMLLNLKRGERPCKNNNAP